MFPGGKSGMDISTTTQVRTCARAAAQTATAIATPPLAAPWTASCSPSSPLRTPTWTRTRMNGRPDAESPGLAQPPLVVPQALPVTAAPGGGALAGPCKPACLSTASSAWLFPLSTISSQDRDQVGLMLGECGHKPCHASQPQCPCCSCLLPVYCACAKLYRPRGLV